MASKKLPVYSRSNPSPEYLRLAKLYKAHHTKSEGKHWSSLKTTYPGQSLWPHLGFIRAIAIKHKAKTVLDYGAGKGYQYSDLRVKESGKSKIYKSVETYWGVDVTCYDPGNPQFEKWPEDIFDGVVSTDVLEHCPKDDLRWIIYEMFEKSEKFIFANIACYPARTVLTTGENAHVTIKPTSWWKDLIVEISKEFPNVFYYFVTTENRSLPGTLITNDTAVPAARRAGALPGNLFKAYLSLIDQRLSRFARSIFFK